MSTVAMAQRVQELDRLYLAWELALRYHYIVCTKHSAMLVQKSRDAYFTLVAVYEPDRGVDDVLTAVDRDVAMASGEPKELTDG